VSRFYVYKLYRFKGYIKKAVESVFKELFIRHYTVSKLKISVLDVALIMKRLLLSHGFKLSENLNESPRVEKMNESKKDTVSQLKHKLTSYEMVTSKLSRLSYFNVKSVYQITRKEMRKMRKTNESTIVDALKVLKKEENDRFSKISDARSSNSFIRANNYSPA
jgi:hypothetical protein